MALFGRDYDREYGSRGGTWGGGRRGPGYDRGYGAEPGYRERGDAYLRMRRYEPDMGGGRRAGMTPGMGRYGYDRDLGASGYDRGYDRGYKSRWQTDYGDPFGDRAARTPMRVIRGEFRRGYDRGYLGGERAAGYDRDYGSNAMGYDPYTGRDGTWRFGQDPYRGAYGRDYWG